MNFLKRLICHHNYEWKYLRLTDGGMKKMYLLTCKKCGKQRYVSI